MHIQKTSGDPAGKTAHERSVKNVQGKSTVPQTPAQVKAAKTQPVQLKSSAANSAVPSISSLISSAKLPVDKLSASIILFARFFSLPLKHEILTAIRRQAFTPQSTAASQNETMKSVITQTELLKQEITENTGNSILTEKNKFTFSLAAAAAESKGAELEAKGLELYANAIDPDMEKRRDANSHDRRRNKKQDEQNNKNEDFNSVSVNGNTLKKIALESAEKNPLLYILNRLPGKDNQRWIVLPFEINENGRNYRVSLRILLETLNHISLMTLDITETGDAEKHSIFTLEAADGKINTLNIYMQPELSPKAKHRLRRELSALLNIPVERVSVIEGNYLFPQESGSRNELFCSINEAV
ncbi:MAG: hypothetical protein LBC76_06420 [Treponema sp.]|nr:hypothetical protein [Treponema sp.]